MSPKNSKNAEKKPATRIPRTYLFAIGVVLVICIAVVAGLVLTKQGPWVPVVPANTSASFTSAGSLYSKSVDLANAGNYKDALEAADAALAQNVSSLTPLIQSNRAGILAMLDRNDEAIAAADVAINAPGNLTTLRSIAWYNKGNALRAEGRISEADAAYANATALDPTLKHP
ncbi:tetratricopeptide repeat protein [Methanoregula sp.]|jgi:tetratricopeptide (TPR) repeat protein|uniref:tetratricopeptide repeat protein n=1 Tax=Methanoregula sp. TaxID=2052170 RepID=UPI003568CA5B